SSNNTMKKISFAFIVLLLIIACQQSSKVEYSDNTCKLIPPFVSRLGFNTKKSYFSTSEKRTMGMVLLEAVDPQNLQAGVTRKYQDSSWKKAGWLAPIQLDDRGNIFTGPAPFINVFNNPASDQNTIYRINGQTGKMDAFVTLPLPDSTTDQNPYGIIGMIYLCESGSLYVSTIAGSNRSSEKGAVYQVNAASGKIEDKLTGMDILGMGIAYTNAERRLFFGKARTPDVYSIELYKKGNFIGKPQPEFSLSGLGPRGDDKVRRIKTNKQGNLEVYGMEFNFNLIAPSEKQETVYVFAFNEADKKWEHQ
ncbi:MAG TPA: hypothetical protein VKI61_03505, partial [Chitinophagaceae bacterium]|nr:hypothetical protein [Chitinophagaceae bacterium]